MVIAEMTELGAFVGEGSAMSPLHQQSLLLKGTMAQEGAAEGHIWLHEPRVVVTNPIADDPHRELVRLEEAVEELRVGVDKRRDRLAANAQVVPEAAGLVEARLPARRGERW